jgi:hypothetical protein
MKNKIESAAPSHPPKAANEDFLPLPNGSVSSGWSAHEIWRVRIKAVLDSRGASSVLTGDVDT